MEPEERPGKMQLIDARDHLDADGGASGRLTGRGIWSTSSSSSGGGAPARTALHLPGLRDAVVNGAPLLSPRIAEVGKSNHSHILLMPSFFTNKVLCSTQRFLNANRGHK